MKNTSRVLTVMAASLVVAIAGCNDSGGGGGSAAVPGDKPTLSTTARSEMTLTADNITEITSTLVALSSDVQASPLTARALDTNNADAGSLSPLAQMSYDMIMEELNNYLRGQHAVQTRSSESFGEGICQTGDILLTETTNTATLDFQNCRNDFGEADTYSFWTGKVTATGTESADYDVDTLCIEDVDVNVKVEDLWFRDIRDGELTGSLFALADMSTTYKSTGCDSDDFKSSFSGYFAIDADGESVGMYNVNVTSEQAGTKNTATTNFVFDASDLDGSLTVFTTSPIEIDEFADYPESGEFGVGTDEANVTFNVNSSDSTAPDAVDVTFVGIDGSCVSGPYSWQEIEAGDFGCH